MRTLLSTRLLPVVLVALTAPVRAQTPAPTPAQTPAPSAPTTPVVTEIVVTGERPAVETRVDRKVYTINRDLQAPLGNAADILRNIPSVSVDIEGIPSLRGDAGVQIFIDGRPAAEFNGANRGAALEQLSADGIERIEVITNPPANFKREGTAGIINIITKQNLHARTASARASLGTGGRYTAGLTQGMRTGKFNLRASAATRHDLRIRDFDDERILRDASGVIQSQRESSARGEDVRQGKSLNLSAGYDANERDRFGFEGNFWRRDATTRLDEHTSILDGSAATVSDTLRRRRSDEYEYVSELGLNWHHAGEAEGDGLDVNLNRADYREHLPWRYTDVSLLPAAPDTFQDQRMQENELTTELSIESTRSFASKARLIYGYDVERVEGLNDFVLTTPALVGAPHVPDANASSHYTYREDVHALFASWEQPLGHWTMLAGLRLEQAEVEAARDYFRAYPSLHFSDALDENHSLTFSYSRRVTRPFWQDLNPSLRQENATSFRQGNPALEPSEVDSLEAGWSFERGPSSLSATVFARRSHDVVTYVTTPLSETVVLSRPENLGESQSGGVELVAAGRLLGSLDYTLSGNAYYNEIDASNLGFSGTRSAISYEGKAAVNWRASTRNRVQLNLATQGKQLSAQGYRRGSTVVDLGYRFQLRPEFALVMTVSDVFAGRRERRVLDTTEISSTSISRQPGRIVFVGFSWSRTADKNPEQFEFDK